MLLKIDFNVGHYIHQGSARPLSSREQLDITQHSQVGDGNN